MYARTNRCYNERRLWAWKWLPLNTYISTYARKNRCYRERRLWAWNGLPLNTLFQCMLERTDAITNEIREPVTFVLAYPTVLITVITKRGRTSEIQKPNLRCNTHSCISFTWASPCGMKLPTHFTLVTSLRMSGSIPSLPHTPHGVHTYKVYTKAFSLFLRLRLNCTPPPPPYLWYHQRIRTPNITTITEANHHFWINAPDSYNILTFEIVAVSVHTAMFNIQKFYMILALRCFVRTWEQTAAFVVYIITWLVFIAVVESVYSAVRTDSLYKADSVWSLNNRCGKCLQRGTDWFLI